MSFVLLSTSKATWRNWIIIHLLRILIDVLNRFSQNNIFLLDQMKYVILIYASYSQKQDNIIKKKLKVHQGTEEEHKPTQEENARPSARKDEHLLLYMRHSSHFHYRMYICQFQYMTSYLSPKYQWSPVYPGELQLSNAWSGYDDQHKQGDRSLTHFRARRKTVGSLTTWVREALCRLQFFELQLPRIS